jgi:hypothetical protein
LCFNSITKSQKKTHIDSINKGVFDERHFCYDEWEKSCYERRLENVKCSASMLI